jgi:predicted ArsR family transcriptional regulator
LKKIHQIKDLDKVKLLADPLRLRLLLAFATGARTAKDVAAELGEPVTKLYRHVDALHAAGLLEVIRERRKRGTIERTFRAIAHRFEVDSSLFMDRDSDSSMTAARDLLRGSEPEILDALARDAADPPLVLRFRIRTSPERIASLRERLLDWVAEAEAADVGDDGSSTEAGALIAFYAMPD